jgi:hypothetical protein
VKLLYIQQYPPGPGEVFSCRAEVASHTKQPRFISATFFDSAGNVSAIF